MANAFWKSLNLGLFCQFDDEMYWILGAIAYEFAHIFFAVSHVFFKYVQEHSEAWSFEASPLEILLLRQCWLF